MLSHYIEERLDIFSYTVQRHRVENQAEREQIDAGWVLTSDRRGRAIGQAEE